MAATAAGSQCTKSNDTSDFGDFVKNEDEELDLEDVVEPCHNYNTESNPHIFYPIYVGEVLNNRYLIEHKIGAGGFSTVWMAHDLQEKKDVALKVMSFGGNWGDNDIYMQDEILREVRDTSRLVTYLATFQLPGNSQFPGEKRNHRVLVFPLRGPCLCPLILEKMSMATRMSAAKQLLEALKNLHEAGIVHRDLNDRNCMWGMVSLSNASRGAKYKMLGRPLKQNIPFITPWKRGELVQPAHIPEHLRTDEFYLGDFGLSMKVGNPVVPSGYPPLDYCSPDRLHGQEPSFACDIWSYMILFCELYLGFQPFQTFLKGGVISFIVRCLGPLPKQWKGLYVFPGAIDSWYDERKMPDQERDLASIIKQFRPKADPVEQNHVLSIMSRVFTYCPEKRPTATQLLQDPSFRAIMDRYGC